MSAGLTSTLDKLLDDTADQDKVAVGDLTRIFGQRGFGPLILLPALIALLPTGAIPGMPTICAITILLVSVQMMFGKESPWLPNRLRNLELRRAKLKSSIERARPYSQRIDKWVKPRFDYFTQPVGRVIVAFICMLLAACMIPLELIPFAAALPASVLVLFGLAFTAHDGLITLVATVLAGLAMVGIFMLIW